MKRLLFLSIINSFILADCTIAQKDKARELWRDSFSLQGESKIQKLKEAIRECRLSEIEVDFYIAYIDSILEDNNQLDLKTLKKLKEEVIKARSINNINSIPITKKMQNSKRLDILSTKID